MATALHNTSVCLHGISEVATSISGNLDVLKAYPLLCDSAREVTGIFHPEPAHASGPFMETNDAGRTLPPREPLILSVMIGLIYCVGFTLFALAKLASLVHRSVPFQKRHADFQALINTIALDFKSRKTLKIILYLNDLYLQDLKISLDLFEALSVSISLEERWIQWQHPNVQKRMMEKYEVEYKSLVEAATQEAGHKLLLTVCPSLEQFEGYKSHNCDKRGCETIGKRRRVWLD